MKGLTAIPTLALFGFIGVACFLASSMASTIPPLAPEPKAGPATIYPDSSQTPGAANPDITQENIADNICNAGWSTSSVRPSTSVTNRIKTQTMKAYGFTDSPTHYELDHVISLQVGGCPDCVENLWPEAYGDIDHPMTQVERAKWNRENPGSTDVLPGSLEKDVVENHVHDEICFDIPNAKMSSLRKKFPPTTSITLQRGQEILASDWYACYLNMMDGNKPCRQPIDRGDQPRWMNIVEPNPQPRGKPVQGVIPPSNDGSNLSPRQRTILTVFFSLIPVPIYIFMRLHEIRRDRLREKMAVYLIERSMGEEGWKFTRFELAGLIRRGRAGKIILWKFWPKPRISINEVVEQAVAELIEAGKYGSPVKGMDGSQRKTLINKLEHLHSDPNSSMDLLGPLPSTMFLVAAVPMIVLFIAIQAVPPVGSFLAGVFGHNSLLEELWTGLLATIVGTGATLLRQKSIPYRETKKPPMKSQDAP